MTVGNWINEILCADAARLILAVLLTVGTLGLLAFGRDVPMALWTLDGAAVGFYFGGQALRNR